MKDLTHKAVQAPNNDWIVVHFIDEKCKYGFTIARFYRDGTSPPRGCMYRDMAKERAQQYADFLNSNGGHLVPNR